MRNDSAPGASCSLFSVCCFPSCSASADETSRARNLSRLAVVPLPKRCFRISFRGGKTPTRGANASPFPRPYRARPASNFLSLPRRMKPVFEDVVGIWAAISAVTGPSLREEEEREKRGRGEHDREEKSRSRVRSLSRSLAPIFMRENLDALTAAILIETKAQRRLTDFMLGHAMPV